MGNEVSAAKVGVSDDNVKERRRTVIASSTTKKVSNFTYYYPNWESYLDDSGNTYYYNQITKETRWNPAEIYEIPVSMDLIDETQEDWDSGPAPSLGTMGKTVSRSVMTDYYEKRARQIQERQELIQSDAFVPWKELSEIGKFDYEAMEDHIEEATNVVLEVSGGNFEPELLYKLPWAYKLQQLSAAVKDSYLQLGDMLDSSKYDNCNDVPRYDNGGLLAWWMDLEEMHSCVDIVLQSGVVGQEADAYSEEMKKLQEIASSGNEEEMIEGFLARKNAVEKELDGLRARCFAVVSLESGPTREQLDNLYMYLKDNVNNGTNLDDIQDEMEEVVSTWLEQKHRFMVDVVLMMGLLEDEHERLQKRIASFNGNGRIRKNGGLNDNGDESTMAIESLDSEDDDDDEDDYQEQDQDQENGLEVLNTINENQNQDNINEQMLLSTTTSISQLDTQQLPENISTTSLQQINGEITQSMIIQNTLEGGIEAQVATPMITSTIDKSTINLDKSIVASKIAEQDAEAKRLAEELAYQKEQRSKLLQDRLAKKKAQRTQELIEEENLDIETAKLKAEVEVAEEIAIEEDEFHNNLLETLTQKDLEIKEKLNQICDEETERITKESEIERETKIKEIKEFYEEEKKKREIEIIEELGCTIEAAAALAEDEIDIKENSDISKIEKDIAEKTEKRRLAVVESIRNEHLKASNFLESELQYQKDQKVKSLKNRLEKRKEIRTNELLNSGIQVHEAVAIADMEVKTKMQIEQKKVEEDIQQKLEETKQKTVQTLKEVQEKEATRLEQDLLYQETRQKKALQERLQKREKKREQALKSEGVNDEEAKKIAELEQKKAEEEAMLKLEQEIKEIKAIQETEAQKLMEYHTTKKESQQKTLKDRLAKRKAKKETELSPEEKLEQFMKTIREKQKINLEKLNQFIESEKIKLISQAEKQDQEDMGTGQHVMQTMFLFGLVKENLVNGYKKQCVYQVRSIKELQKLENLTSNEHNKAMFTASEQLIIQHCRDLKSLMDTQISEQQRTRIKLEEDCAPIDKIIDMEEKYYKRNIDSLRKQQSKLSLALAGVHINMDWLIMKEGSKKKDFIDEDEDDIFGDSNNQQDLWSDEICQWFEGSINLQNIYDKVPEALLSKFQSVMLQYKAQVHAGEASAGDLPVVGAVLYQVTLVLLKAISESYQAQISDYSNVYRYSNASPDDIKPYIIQAVENAKSNLSLEAAFNTMDANQSIQSKFKKALQEFLENPTIPTPEFYQILQAMKIKAQPVAPPPVPEIVTPSQKIIKPKETIQVVDESEERKNRMIKSIETRVERKRRDIQEKYRKRMDQKIHECKDAKIDLPEDFAAEEEKCRKEELNNLSLALEEVKDLVHNNSDSLKSVSVDGLMHAIEKKLKGEEIETTDLKQLEIEAAKENEKAEAKRLLKMQKDEAEKLDVMLKVQRAREQQALQKRLLARKTKGQK